MSQHVSGRWAARRPTRGWLAFLAGAASLFAGCHDVAPGVPAPVAPERTFILTGATFEDRRDGQVLWRGQGRRADGDLGVMHVDDLILRRVPQQPGQQVITLCAVLADIDFDAGVGEFDQLRVCDGSGATLEAPSGRYDEAAGTIEAAAPTQFRTATLVAHAANAVFLFRDGTVTIEGPVHGTLSALPSKLDVDACAPGTTMPSTSPPYRVMQDPRGSAGHKAFQD